MGLRGRDLISIRDLSREEIEEALKASRRMLPYAEGAKVGAELDGKVLTLAFFEPSTRTRLSFDTAMARLGGRSVTISDPSATSLRKGETLSDTIRVIGQVRRRDRPSPPERGGRPPRGAGLGQTGHQRRGRRGTAPDQTLIDLAAIEERFGTLEDLDVVLLGDLNYGRTVHSLAQSSRAVRTSRALFAPYLADARRRSAATSTAWEPKYTKSRTSRRR